MNIYPIKFEPILQEKIWGGSKLQSVLNKKCTSDTTGESWEISGVEGNISQVANGDYKGESLVSLLENHTSDFVGAANYERFGNEFPLLIKFLDAKTNLSVQVHPDDEMAQRDHNSYGKTEMWYIMDHEEEAEIILGLKDKNANTEILRDVTGDNVYDVFNKEKVTRGDAYFIPAGKIHAIGAGVLAAEIQQTSDITYRVYDWDRTDKEGQKRDLHLDQSVAATKEFTEECKKECKVEDNVSQNVVACDYFTTNSFNVNSTFQRSFTNLDSFVILMCVEGSASVTVNGKTEIVSMGETLLLPAQSEEAYFFAQNAKFLEVYID
ncbi:mannose-6-phosphate isomerase [Dokdonia sp. MED134]|uniref:type I phosphomannose isomerase catalytic subunit n=1 Tax=Dokdonia sp. MED134 TaxID=313590 RepID=UPI000068AAAE|nr:type I phosphomannose isomerase catalytic subunit [Dokdonia sp. MED134]EAQ40425.1 mannose-6-phosphate isomerase [Dokdonia sp. MED134]